MDNSLWEMLKPEEQAEIIKCGKEEGIPEGEIIAWFIRNCENPSLVSQVAAFRTQRRELAIDNSLPAAMPQKKPDPVKPIRADKKPGRNSPCPCGSGKKYKACCYEK